MQTRPEKVTVQKGQLFIEGTAFLTLGRNSRAQEVYEADVVRIDPINP